MKRKLIRIGNSSFVLLFYILILVFLTDNLSAQKYADSVLYWNSTKLSWKNFKGEVPTLEQMKKSFPDLINGKQIANTHSEILGFYSKDQDTFIYNVVCQFLIYKSWTITHYAYSLNHEQKHFDIAEINARHLRKYYSNIITFSKQQIDNNADSILSNGNNLQKLYDKETNYGSDTIMQRKWDKKIQQMLDSLKEYENPKGWSILKK